MQPHNWIQLGKYMVRYLKNYIKIPSLWKSIGQEMRCCIRQSYKILSLQSAPWEKECYVPFSFLAAILFHSWALGITSTSKHWGRHNDYPAECWTECLVLTTRPELIWVIITSTTKDTPTQLLRVSDFKWFKLVNKFNRKENGDDTWQVIHQDIGICSQILTYHSTYSDKHRFK